MLDVQPFCELLARCTRWEHTAKRRYYEVRVCQDLLGETVVMSHWGGIGSARGGGHERVVEPASLMGALAAIHRRRCQRGYRLVAGAALDTVRAMTGARA